MAIEQKINGVKHANGNGALNGSMNGKLNRHEATRITVHPVNGTDKYKLYVLTPLGEEKYDPSKGKGLETLTINVDYVLMRELTFEEYIR